MAALGAAAVQKAMPPKVRRIRSFHDSHHLMMGEVFTCVGTLAILDRLEEVDAQMLAWWLAERQLPSGGLNGRPQKLEDVSRI